EKKTKIVITEPKSLGSDRVIPLNNYALELCKKWYASDPQAYVLTGDPERYIEPRTMQNKLKKYTSECGLSEVHFHSLRHTFATRCVEVGFEIKSLSEILGHASPRITLERYVHSSLELKRDNMDKLAAIGY
ncbi:MAG: tyrosine-type recombinase/integrase, partial [Roseburia sp.]|nr:tyrosine-type recombinase/integrase [Roseburia sp.]